MRVFVIGMLTLLAAHINGQPLLHPWQVVDNGGGRSTASSVVLHSSAGQPAPGRRTATSSVLTSGYLPGLQQYRSEYVGAILAVSAGWNLVSLPLIVGDSRTTAVFQTATSLAYDYTPGIGYDSAVALSFGRGYWLKFPADQSVPLVGFWKVEDTIEVSQGWNIIGSVSGTTDVASIVQDPGGIVASSYFSFGTTGYTPVASIEPGGAVWVKVSQSGTLRLAAPSRTLRPVSRTSTKNRSETPPREEKGR